MVIENCWCVRENENIDLIESKDLYIFTTGIDAENASKLLDKKCKIVGYVDNKRNGNYFFGKTIISLKEYLNIKNTNKYLMIACYRYGGEIIEQVEANGLKIGRDYVVWDDLCVFNQDDNTSEYIELMRHCWGDKKVKKPNGIILVPYDSRHDLLTIPYSYSSNYFATKYESEIKAYIRFGAGAQSIVPSVQAIYSAFNVTEIINPILEEKQKREVERLVLQIWGNLYTWEDWKNIYVYDIHFGTTIIRHFLRMYIPDFDLRSKKMFDFLKECINTIVFWYDFFNQNNVNIVILADGVSWDGYIRDIAITNGIPTYALGYKMKRCNLDYYDSQGFEYFDKFWDTLTLDEQKYGIKWAKKQLAARLQGNLDEVFNENRKGFVFALQEKRNRVVTASTKTKIMICPHIFEEDCYACGNQIFDDNFFAWLTHLGELSNKLENYDWYLKLHPYSSKRDLIIFDKILKRYPNIKLLQADVSPWQLKKEGIKFALTVFGSIGFEYPLVGIQVINAGKNLQQSFDFNWNPKTKEEYDQLIFHLDDLGEKKDEEGLYKFYALNFLFYDWDYINEGKIFFDDPMLGLDKDALGAYDLKLGTWKYKKYIATWTEQKHLQLYDSMEEIFNKLDAWKPNVFYRK